MTEKYIQLSLGDEKIKTISEILGNKTCNRILDLLVEQEATVTELSQQLHIPLNTTDYNVKKLVKAGLIEQAKSWWSIKGKKMPSYKISHKKIIITPKEKKNTTKNLLLTTGIITIATIIIKTLTNKQYPEAIMDTYQETASMTLSQAAPKMVEATTQNTWMLNLNPWHWFIIGAALTLLLYHLITYLTERRNT